ATQLLDTGSFTVYAGVDPKNAAESLREIAKELRRAREGVTAQELVRAQGLLESRIQLYVEDTGAVAAWHGGRAVRGLPPQSPEEAIAAFNAVTLDDVRAVANDVLTEERLRLAVVGPFESEAILDGVTLGG